MTEKTKKLSEVKEQIEQEIQHEIQEIQFQMVSRIEQLKTDFGTIFEVLGNSLQKELEDTKKDINKETTSHEAKDSTSSPKTRKAAPDAKTQLLNQLEQVTTRTDRSVECTFTEINKSLNKVKKEIEKALDEAEKVNNANIIATAPPSIKLKKPDGKIKKLINSLEMLKQASENALMKVASHEESLESKEKVLKQLRNAKQKALKSIEQSKFDISKIIESAEMELKKV